MSDETDNDVEGRGRPFSDANRGGGRRQKGSRNRKTILEEFANEKHDVTENGRRRKRTSLEILTLTLKKHAIGGDAVADRYIVMLIERLAPSARQGRFLVVPPQLEMDEWLLEASDWQQELRRLMDEAM